MKRNMGILYFHSSRAFS